MSPSIIDMEQALNHLGQAFKTQQPLSQRPHPAMRIKASTEKPIAGAEVHQGRSVFRRLQAINASLSGVATNVRAADQIMDTIGKYIERVKAQLERIIKNYPPFPPGSEERVRALRSYNALRRQIDQMVFPPKDRGPTKVIADPIVVTANHNQRGGDLQTPSTRDLKLSELPDTATDQEIAAAINRLTGAEKTLRKSRARLTTEALGISFPEVAGQKWAGLDSDEKEVEFDLSEGTAELKSRELRRTLSTETTKNVIESQSLFVSLSSESE
jgi:hypothetical protein